MRTYDPVIVQPAIDHFLKDNSNRADLNEWLSKEYNIALVNEVRDLAVFERTKPGIYRGHYFFQSRGRKAITAGKDFLDEIFDPCYNIKVITGLTPISNLAARWLSRQIGFKSNGIIKLFNNPYELFILTDKDHISG